MSSPSVEGWAPPGGDWMRVTIDDAEIAGWPWLKVTCGCKVALLPWRLIRRRTRYRRLGEIIERLRCESCGHPPRDVSLYWMGGRDGADEREAQITCDDGRSVGQIRDRNDVK